MRRRVEYHRDGTWRMDFLTFCDLKADKVYDHLTRGKPLHVAQPKVREFK